MPIVLILIVIPEAIFHLGGDGFNCPFGEFDEG
jgi:hypothetical protein